jgi:hypothetical protein
VRPIRQAHRLSLNTKCPNNLAGETDAPPYSTLTPIHIYDYAASLLEPYLQWHDYGPKCTVKVLLQVLFYAAGHVCSVFAACSQLRTAPTDQAVRDALTADAN